MTTLAAKRIIVGVTGSIAAYKSAELIRLLCKQAAQVRVVMTAGAKAFITPISLQAISGNTVHDELLSREAEMAMGHIELARWADTLVIAPASANFMARLAAGFADDLLTTLCLATRAPLLIAPAMNQHMWAHPATQANAACLRARGTIVLEPDEGGQACGDHGIGRMPEPWAIVEALQRHSLEKSLQGKKILLTAGPTREAIDPVRYLSNHSSGKMGYAIAQAAVAMGAEVTLISGPVNLAPPIGVTVHQVVSAKEMYEAVMAQVTEYDIFIATAAVADYAPQQIANQKLKKQQTTLKLELVHNPDIVASVAQLPQRPITVGFAAETENLLVHAQQKLANKQLDMIIANEVGENKVFGQSDNKVWVLLPQAQPLEFPAMSKIELARKLLVFIKNNLLKKRR